MADDELTAQLKRWGIATMARFAINDDGPSAGDHILAKNRDLAPGSRENFERELVGRDGGDRRRYMARMASSDKLKLSIIPVWAVDPVRGRNDAGRPRELERQWIDLGVPDELRWIDSALAQMSRSHPIRALILREEYCGAGTHAAKCARVQYEYGGTLSVRQYRAELKRGLEWLDGKRAA
jgi:hypothetical protein